MSDVSGVPGLVLPATFNLTDAEGVEHTYVSHLFGPDDGEKILWQLVALVGPSSVGLVIALAMGESLGDAIDTSIDIGAVGSELSMALRKTNMPGLRRAILLQTYRDGKQLKDANNFRVAYTANYAELLRAQWEVLRANRLFLGLATLLSDLKPSKPAATLEAEPSDSSQNVPHAEA
jgi:hypothetical protein